MGMVEALPYERSNLVDEVVFSKPCSPAADFAADVAT